MTSKTPAEFKAALKAGVPYVDHFVIKKMEDSDPDLSYLEQDYRDVESKTEREKCLEQDRQRIESFNRGYWCMIGIRAECVYHIPSDDKTSVIIQTLTSGGLWGIESDSEESYFKEVANEELAQLKQYCDKLGIKYDNETPIQEVSE